MAKLTPMPTQIAGANFLAVRRRALLADEPRVGKTGAAILAADKIQAKTIIVVTTASGRAVWRHAFDQWSDVPRVVKIFGVDRDWEKGDAIVMSWAATTKFPRRAADLIILDEDHQAKSPDAQRTRAVYGWLHDGGRTLITGSALVKPDARCWHLTGTPSPHDPGDMYMRLRASAPERLAPDVLTYDAFRARYCIIKPKQLSNGSWIEVVIGGRNEDELRNRIGDFMLRRTQADVGIHPPLVDTFPLIATEAQHRLINASVDQERVLEEIEGGDSSGLDLAKLRRITGTIKAPAIVAAIKDEFDGGLDKIVLAYWHRDVGDILEEGLQSFGVARIDGATDHANRDLAQARFKHPDCRVFLGQIAAAGEAIDLSAAAELWFAEVSFTPAHIAQMMARIANVTAKRNTTVRFCAIANSIDEVMQERVAQLSMSINRILQKEAQHEI